MPLFSAPALGDPRQALRTLVGALAVVALMLVTPSRPDANPTIKRAAAVAAALGAWILIAAAAGQPASSLWGVHGRLQGVTTITLLLACAVTGTLLARSSARTLAMAVSVSASVVAVVTLYQTLTGADPSATLGNSAIAGSWLAVGAGVGAAGALTASNPRWRWAMATAAILSAAASAASGSRAAVLAVLVSIAVLAAAFGRRKNVRPGVLIAAAAIVLVVGAGLGGMTVLAKFTPQALVSGSAASRLEIWRSTAGMVAARPLLGVGTGRFLYEFPAYQSAAHAAIEGVDTRADQAHSLPLQYAAESGVPAGLLVVALGAIALVAAWRAARSGDGAALVALGGLTAYSVQALLGVAAIETDALGWLLGGIAVASAAGRLTPTSVPVARIATGLTAAIVTALMGWYLVANAQYGRGADTFLAGDFVLSQASMARAVATDPLTDIYRVGLADSASYLGAGDVDAALTSLNAGLKLEPRSYDLALSRARLMSLRGDSADSVADAYGMALALYPRGMTVRVETIDAFTKAGRTEQADRLEAELASDASARRVSP